MFLLLFYAFVKHFVTLLREGLHKEASSSNYYYYKAYCQDFKQQQLNASIDCNESFVSSKICKCDVKCHQTKRDFACHSTRLLKLNIEKE